MMVKLGVIGLGHMGGYHASITQTLQQAQLVAVADPTEANWQKVKNPDVLKTKDFNDWLDKVDGVIIAVPTVFHYPVAKVCLARGKHVLIEKPLTNNIEHAQELFELANQHNCTLHVGHVERFNGSMQELKKIIHKPNLIECHRMGPFAPRVQKDSVILDLMIHDLDLVLGLVDANVTSFSVHGTKVYSDLCDVASVQLSFDNGCIASIIASRASQIKKRSMAVHQKAEYVHLDFSTQELTIHRHTSHSTQLGNDQLKYRQEGTVEHVFVHKDNPLKQEIEYFVNAIRTGSDRVNPTQDLRALKLTFDIERTLELQ